MTRLTKIALTGAAGALGGTLRAPLAAMCDALVSTDIAAAPDDLAANESWVQADLADLASVERAIAGAEMVVHFGAIVDEVPFDDIWPANFLGAYNVWEAAHRTGARRVVYASSIHACGMVELGEAGLEAALSEHRPDTFYGLAKCFAEDLGKLYWDKRDLESVCLRIMSCTEEPQNIRALSTWLSRPDLVRLVQAAITAPVTGFQTVWGVSANDRAPTSNAAAAFLGYRPRDNAEDWAEALLAAAPVPDPRDPSLARLGGPFAKVPLGESGVAAIKAMSDPD
ncbi:MAG: NAD-dependent epimerase/dehydratase family protein [Paracoccaceae bacterium]